MLCLTYFDHFWMIWLHSADVWMITVMLLQKQNHSFPRPELSTLTDLSAARQLKLPWKCFNVLILHWCKRLMLSAAYTWDGLSSCMGVGGVHDNKISLKSLQSTKISKNTYSTWSTPELHILWSCLLTHQSQPLLVRRLLSSKPTPGIQPWYAYDAVCVLYFQYKNNCWIESGQLPLFGSVLHLGARVYRGTHVLELWMKRTLISEITLV